MSDDIVARLRTLTDTLLLGDFQGLAATTTSAADEIERLRAERDEARRMWCEAEPVGNSLSVDDMDRRARAEAKRRGWDCYKESTDGK